MAFNPQPRGRVRTRLGPIKLPRRLEQPDVAVDGAPTTVTQEPDGEPTIYQRLSPGLRNFTVKGTAFREHAIAIDKLIAGGPFRVISDRLDNAAWCQAQSVSTQPVRWVPSRGQWGYEYTVELVETRPPADGNARHPLPIEETSTRSNPPARHRKSARVGNVELPYPINMPEVAVDGASQLTEHEPLNKDPLVRWRGRDALQFTVRGPADRQIATRLDALQREDNITIRTDRYTGPVVVENVSTAPEKIRYASGNWGHSYTLEFKELRGNP